MKRGPYYTLVIACLSGLVVLIIDCSISESVIAIPEKYKLPIHELMPQGWSFFTRSPREEMAEIYQVDKSDRVCKITTQCSAPSNLFGLSRRSRKIGMELSIIASKINDSSWVPKGINKVDIKSLPVHPVKLDGNADDRIIKSGNYLITAETPIPWAWSQNEHTQKKARIIRIQIL